MIIQASRGARQYANDAVLAGLIDALVDIYPAIPVCMHQDHGNNEATCATAIRYGFTSVMMDGSPEACLLYTSEFVAPPDQLRARARDQDDRRIARIAGGLVIDGRAGACREWHGAVPVQIYGRKGAAGMIGSKSAAALVRE